MATAVPSPGAERSVLDQDAVEQETIGLVPRRVLEIEQRIEAVLLTHGDAPA